MTHTPFQSPRRPRPTYNEDLYAYLLQGNAVNFVTAKTHLGIMKLDYEITELRNAMPVYERMTRANNIQCLEYSLKPF